MTQAIKPLGDLITTLPAGPEYPGRTAGPSFELFYESDYVLPHREAAWVLLAERIEQAAAFCEPPGAGVTPEVSGKLAQVRDALAAIARSLAAHLPSRQVPSAPPAEELPALLDRALSLCRTSGGDSSDDTGCRGVSTVARAAYLVVEHACRSAIIDSGRRGGGSDYATACCGRSPTFRRHAAGRRAALPHLPVPEPRVSDGSVAELVATRRDGRDPAARAAGRTRRRRELLEAVAALQAWPAPWPPLGAAGTEFAALQRGPPAAADRGRAQRAVPGHERAAVRSHLGEPLPVPPQVALCRCGQSARQAVLRRLARASRVQRRQGPQPGPGPARHLPGRQVTVFDNRGICQHSGFCTDRLPPVSAPSARAVRGAERRPDGRDRPGRPRLPVRGAEHGAVDGTEARDLSRLARRRASRPSRSPRTARTA